MNKALPIMFKRVLILASLFLLPLLADAQCSATFSYQVNGLTVTFAGVTNPPASPNTSYYWWFSDMGNNSSVQNPVYTFSAPGTYVVCFSYYDFVTTCQDSVCQTVTVSGGCTADFTSLDTAGSTYFMSTTTASNPTYFWDFGDGNFSTQAWPWHQYANPGTYTVCLTVYDSAVFCDSTCHTVVVPSSGGCTADFTAMDTSGYWYFLSTTTASQPATYFWDFGDGNYSTTANPWHQYANPGTYTVCLTVYDANQQFCDSTCHTVIVQSSGGCTATFTAIDSLGYVFFVSSTTAGSGAIYFWDFGDGNYSSAQNPSHVYASPGTYTVCLTVYDSMQNFCDSVCYTVQATTVGVEETNYLQSSFGAAPNPADGSLTLSFMTINSGNVTIKFFDASGRMAGAETVAAHGAGYNKTEINTITMAQGIYLVKIEVDGTEAWTRIAVTHQ